jgi:hypothetical protein
MEAERLLRNITMEAERLLRNITMEAEPRNICRGTFDISNKRCRAPKYFGALHLQNISLSEIYKYYGALHQFYLQFNQKKG